MWSDGVSEYWSNEKTKKTPDLYFLDQHSTTPVLRKYNNYQTQSMARPILNIHHLSLEFKCPSENLPLDPLEFSLKEQKPLAGFPSAWWWF